MTARDSETLQFYADEAAAYTSRGQAASTQQLELFLATLPAGAAILELGCGGGQDSEFMIARGFDVTPTDGTPEMAQAAQNRLGRPVATLLFGDIADISAYDGIWANACLLHVPRADLSGIVGRIHRALKPGGVFYASFKAGENEGRDRFDRYYNYPSAAWLQELYTAFGWQHINISAEHGSGYDQQPTDWLHVTAVKSV
jgi:SAM-dependent methyltransferase